MYEIKETGKEYPTKTQVFSKQERQLAFVEALKAVDYEKEYETALKDLAEVIFDLDVNNDVEPINNAD